MIRGLVMLVWKIDSTHQQGIGHCIADAKVITLKMLRFGIVWKPL